MGRLKQQMGEHYRQTLQRYLADTDKETALLEAYELGREALSNGLGLLDLTSMHHAALKAGLADGTLSADSTQKLFEAAGFFDEVLSPYEMSRLGTHDANVALRRLYEVLETEAKRIAHILHDESGQILATVYLELAEIKRNSSDDVINKVNHLTGMLDEVREQLRRLSHELRPLILDQLGLMPALQFLADGVRKRSGLTVEIEGSTDGRLHPSVETVLYRTVQEALSNVTRHSKATTAAVKVWIESDVINCSTRDNGIGFELPRDRKQSFQGLGLIGIQERITALNGTLNLVSSPGHGTTLQVSIPL